MVAPPSGTRRHRVEGGAHTCGLSQRNSSRRRLGFAGIFAPRPAASHGSTRSSNPQASGPPRRRAKHSNSSGPSQAGASLARTSPGQHGESC